MRDYSTKDDLYWLCAVAGTSNLASHLHFKAQRYWLISTWFIHNLICLYTLVLRQTFIVCDCKSLALLHWIRLTMKMFDCIWFVQAFKECKTCTFQRMELEFKEANCCWNPFYLRFSPFFPIFYRCWFDLKLQWIKKTMEKKSNTSHTKNGRTEGNR